MGTKLEKLVKDSPLILQASEADHILIFRQILELSMKKGYWSGAVGHA